MVSIRETAEKNSKEKYSHIGEAQLADLKKSLEGDFHYDQTLKILYATDASVYRSLPLAVSIPKNTSDLKKLIQFANLNKVALIPRAAGTSLAGQCVGTGIVVDISKYFTEILEFNEQEKWVRVQPGVVRDELNLFLKPYNLMFGPNTSTSNRCMIGGMVGNNSCGSSSIKYGNTRQHVLELKTILSDGSESSFAQIDKIDFEKKCQGDSLESKIHRCLKEILSDHNNQCEIINEFPKEEVTRRNTGYALDELLFSDVFADEDKPLNICELLTGSEGTLAFTTEIKLNLVPLPPKEKAVICAHFASVNEALKSVSTANTHEPFAVELMDDEVMNCTIGHIQYEKYRFFIKGDPKAILAIEVAADSETNLESLTNALIQDLQSKHKVIDVSIIKGDDINKVWALRKAGLGLLSNIPGDAKAIAVVEDTAVAVEDLPEYIEEFKALLDQHGLKSVYYAHAGEGELHYAPYLILKRKKIAN